jgi:hypothetical protein
VFEFFSASAGAGRIASRFDRFFILAADFPKPLNLFRKGQAMGEKFFIARAQMIEFQL